VQKLMNWLKAPEWSPYAGGAGLGVLSILALLFTDRLFGASGAFENIGGAVMKWIAPSLAGNMYWNYVMPAGFSIGVMMLIGIFLGSFLSALASGTFRWRTISDDQWMAVFGPNRWKRWAALFFGGLNNGTANIQRSLGIPQGIAASIQGITLLFVIGSQSITLARWLRKRRTVHLAEHSSSTHPVH